MRKRLITPTREKIRTRGEGWLDIERAAVVEFTSEDPDYPIESAFVSGEARGLAVPPAPACTTRIHSRQTPVAAPISFLDPSGS